MRGNGDADAHTNCRQEQSVRIGDRPIALPWARFVLRYYVSSFTDLQITLMRSIDGKLIGSLKKKWNPNAAIRVLCISAVVLFIYGLGSELIYLYRHEVIYLNIPLKAIVDNNDQNLYFAEGRAWLNGLTYYKDLFETKPPIIFMIAAFSLLVTGGNSLLLWLQLLCLILFGLAVIYFAYSQVQQLEVSTRYIVTGVALLLGLLFIVETVDREPGYGPEGFALLFATIPAFCLAYRKTYLGIVAGIALGIAAMIKEPFAPSAILAMLVFCKSRDDLYRAARIVLVGIAAALIILQLSGAVNAYFTIYLPEMFSGRSVGALIYPDYASGIRYVIPVPLWMKGLNAYRLLIDLGLPFPRIFLALFLFTSLISYVLLRGQDFRARSVLMCVAALLVGLFSAHQLYTFLELFNGIHNLHQPFPWLAPLSIRFLTASILPPLTMLVAAWISGTKNIAWYSLVLLLGMMACSSLVAFNGDFAGNYFVFAFPPLISICLYCVIEMARQQRYMLLAATGLLLTLHTAMPFQYDQSRMNNSLGDLYLPDSVADAHENVAVSLDTLLTTCHADRYLIAQTNPELKYIFALTKYSPYQITYGQQRALGGFAQGATDKPNGYLADQLRRDLATTRIIIASETGSIPSSIAQVIQDDFSERGDCGSPIPGLRVFFRKALAD